jgi:hypothetical protein
MPMITCPCCGGRGEIEEQRHPQLTPLQFRIYDVVRRSPCGINVHNLVDKVYADRADGGPDTAMAVVRSLIWKINTVLAPTGARIRGTSTGRSSVYKLQRLV